MLKETYRKTASGEQSISPEEAFDRRVLSGGYVYFIWVVMFLLGGIGCFTGLFSKGAAIAVAALFATLIVTVVLCPLIWEFNGLNRPARRIRRAAFFPIRMKEFVSGKIKLTMQYLGIFWLASLFLQVIGIPLFGAGNILAFQSSLLLAGMACMAIYLLMGTVGAKMGE